MVGLFGFDHGLDFSVIFSILLIFYLIFRLFIRLEELNLKIIELARSISLEKIKSIKKLNLKQRKQ